MHDPYQYLLQVECLKYRRKSRIYLFFPLGGTFSALWVRMQPETVYAQRTVTIKTTNLLSVFTALSWDQSVDSVDLGSVLLLMLCRKALCRKAHISFWSLRLNSTRTKTEVYFNADLIRETWRQPVSKSSYGIRDGTAWFLLWELTATKKTSTASLHSSLAVPFSKPVDFVLSCHQTVGIPSELQKLKGSSSFVCLKLYTIPYSIANTAF